MCKHIILDIVLVVQFLVFVYFRVLGFKSIRQNKWYLPTNLKIKCNKNSRFEILVTSLCNANSNILQILSLYGAVLEERASVFSYPGYTETVKYQIAKNCYCQ